MKEREVSNESVLNDDNEKGVAYLELRETEAGYWDG